MIGKTYWNFHSDWIVSIFAKPHHRSLHVDPVERISDDQMIMCKFSGSFNALFSRHINHHKPARDHVTQHFMAEG